MSIPTAFNPLTEYPHLRKIAYAVQWVVNLALGVTSVVFIALDQSPLWFVITTGAFNFVWSYTGLTAQSHTEVPDGD